MKTHPLANATTLPHFIVFIVLFFAIWTIRATLLFAIDQSISDSSARLLYGNTIKFLIWVVPVVLYLKMLDRTDPLIFLKLNKIPSLPNLVLAVGASLFFFTLIIIIEAAVNQRTLDRLFTSSSAEMVSIFLSTLVSPIWEEIFFRGFALRKLQELWSFWPANIVASVLFVFIHWPNWIWTGGLSQTLIATSLSVLIFSLFVGWIARITDSLYPSMAIHVINNIISAFLG